MTTTRGVAPAEPVRSEAHADDRRRALAAATGLLTRRGVRELKVEGVLREARLSTRAFYRHFGNKHDLVRALIEQSSRDLAARTEVALQSDPDPVLGLRAWLEVVLESGDSRHPSLEAALVWHSNEVRLLYPEAVRQAVALVLEPLVDALRRVRADGRPHVHPRQDAAAFLLLVRAVQAQLVAPDGGLSREDALQTVWSLMARACTLGEPDTS